MPAQREADVPTTTFLTLKRECPDNVLDSVHFSAATSCQHESDMFLRDDVTWMSFLSSPRSSSPCLRRSFVLARKRDWYRRWSRSPKDAHVQLFGHFVAVSQLHILGNRGHRSESRLVILSPFAGNMRGLSLFLSLFLPLVSCHIIICPYATRRQRLYFRIIIVFLHY